MRRDGFPEFTQLVERPDAFRGLGQLLQRLGHIVHQLVRRGGVDGLLAAATSEAEPGPAYILAELISGGNAPKSTTSIILPLGHN